jgi:hypothetical protein
MTYLPPWEVCCPQQTLSQQQRIPSTSGYKEEHRKRTEALSDDKQLSEIKELGNYKA